MILLVDTGHRDVDSFSTKIISLFNSRIVGLIFYGSNAFNRSRGDQSDFDLYLMLSYPEDSDYEKLKEILETYSNIDFTVQYLSILKVRGWENYQFGNHGVFYAEMLGNAITLYGENVFESVNVQKELIDASICRQIEEHLWRIDQWILTYSPASKEGRYKFVKYFCRVSIHMMIMTNALTFKEVNFLNDIEFINNKLVHCDVFSQKTKDLMIKLADNNLKSTSELQELRLQLYTDFLKML